MDLATAQHAENKRRVPFGGLAREISAHAGTLQRWSICGPLQKRGIPTKIRDTPMNMELLGILLFGS